MARKNKIYLALVAVALAALGIDRFFLGTTAPAKSSAAPLAGGEEDPAGSLAPDHLKPKSPVLAAPPTGVPELRFPRQLPTYDPQVEIRDPFSRTPMPGTTGNPPEGATSPTSGKNAQSDTIGREAFSTSHVLHAILIQDGLKIALLDSRWLQVGDALDTCTLIAIEGETAAFECHDGVTELSISKKRGSRTAKD